MRAPSSCRPHHCSGGLEARWPWLMRPKHLVRKRLWREAAGEEKEGLDEGSEGGGRRRMWWRCSASRMAGKLATSCVGVRATMADSGSTGTAMLRRDSDDMAADE